jgi:hypothetical protein
LLEPISTAKGDWSEFPSDGVSIFSQDENRKNKIQGSKCKRVNILLFMSQYLLKFQSEQILKLAYFDKRKINARI